MFKVYVTMEHHHLTSPQPNAAAGWRMQNRWEQEAQLLLS